MTRLKVATTAAALMVTLASTPTLAQNNRPYHHIDRPHHHIDAAACREAVFGTCTKGESGEHARSQSTAPQDEWYMDAR